MNRLVILTTVTKTSNGRVLSTHITRRVVVHITRTNKTKKIVDIRIVVNPSVTEGRRRVRTLTKGTRAVRDATVKSNIKNQVWTFIKNGSP